MKKETAELAHRSYKMLQIVKDEAMYLDTISVDSIVAYLKNNQDPDLLEKVRGVLKEHSEAEVRHYEQEIQKL